MVKVCRKVGFGGGEASGFMYMLGEIDPGMGKTARVKERRLLKEQETLGRTGESSGIEEGRLKAMGREMRVERLGWGAGGGGAGPWRALKIKARRLYWTYGGGCAGSQGRQRGAIRAECRERCW